MDACFNNASAVQQASATQGVGGRRYAGYETAPSGPGPAVTTRDLIERSARVLERIRAVAELGEMLNDRITGSSRGPEGVKGEGTSPMAGSNGEQAHLLHLQHATLDRVEVALQRLLELQG